MDVNDLRSIVTLVSLLCFAGIAIWAWARTNRGRFEEARLLPFIDEAAPHAANATDKPSSSQ